MRLENKNFIVTGALGGIGAAIVQRFAEEGACVLLTDISDNGADDTITRLASLYVGSFYFHMADLSNEPDVEKLFNQADQYFQQLNGVINVAGYDYENGIAPDKISAQGLDKCIDANLKTTVLCCEKAIDRLKPNGGYIVNICSKSYLGSSRQIAYSATKGAVYSYTRSLAMQLGNNNIRVNAIAPGFTEVAAIKKEIPVYVWPLLKWFMSKRTLLGRIAQPLDIANAAVFLSSDDASFITGQTLEVAGGT